MHPDSDPIVNHISKPAKFLPEPVKTNKPYANSERHSTYDRI